MSGWPFVVGDRVTCRGNWGPLVDALRADSQANPGKVYTVHDSKGDGRWISLRDDAGRLFCHGDSLGPSIGHSYFRIAGDCGTHRRSYSSELGWHCARCDEPMPGGAS